MRRDRYHQEDSSEDSFLDVVANVVGVLIILVMLVGAQASRSAMLVDSPVQPTPDVQPELVAAQPEHDVDKIRNELSTAEQEALSERRAVEQLAVQVVKLEEEARAYDRQRVELATYRSVIEDDIERRKNQLDEQKQQEFEVQRRLFESKLSLDKLTKEQFSLLAAPEKVTEVECVPTPLAKVIEGESIHLRLSKGLVSVVPFNELIAEMPANLDGLRYRLQNSNKVAETFGPINGYRLKFTVEKFQSAGAVTGPLVGQIQRPTLDLLAEFIPVTDEMGQTVEQSLLPGGSMDRLLREQRQRNPSFVVWLYTDSFDDYRPLKRALWEHGYTFAARPMRPGRHIGASPRGTKAAAQ